jgi:hypothetical protein
MEKKGENIMMFPNKPGDYSAEGLRIRVTPEHIYIDASALLSPTTDDIQSPSAYPINRESRRPRHMREIPEKPKDELMDRLGKSAVKSIKYMNDIFWGEK